MNRANAIAEDGTVKSLKRADAANALASDSAKSARESAGESKRLADAGLNESRRLNGLTADLVETARRQVDIANRAIEESNQQAAAMRDIAGQAIAESKKEAAANRELQEKGVLMSEKALKISGRARVLAQNYESAWGGNLFLDLAGVTKIEAWNGTFNPVVATVVNLGESSASVTIRANLVYTERPVLLLSTVVGPADKPLYPKCGDIAPTKLDVTKQVERGKPESFMLARVMLATPLTKEQAEGGSREPTMDGLRRQRAGG